MLTGKTLFVTLFKKQALPRLEMAPWFHFLDF